jgi:hypothetical protein
MKKDVVPIECVARRISYFRGQKAIVNRDLALETKILARDKTQREIRFHVSERPPQDGTGKRR